MASSSNDKTRITHIEIRRVQNGFVVMGIDSVMDNYMDANTQRRVSYVADSPEALGRLIETLATDCAEFVWSPSVDVPMTTMTRRINADVENRARAKAEEIMKSKAWVTSEPLKFPPADVVAKYPYTT